MAEGYRAGELGNRMAEGALRQKSRASGFGPNSVTAVPFPPLPRARSAYLQEERVGWPENSAIPCSRDPQRGPHEPGTSSSAAHDLSMAVRLPLCRRAKASPGPARREAPDGRVAGGSRVSSLRQASRWSLAMLRSLGQDENKCLQRNRQGGKSLGPVQEGNTHKRPE